MLNLSLEILKKDTSFPGTEREGVVASGGVGMTLVSKIVCHWQRQKNTNVAQGGSYFSASNFRNYLDFKEQLLHCYNFFAYDLHIAKNKKPTTTNDNNKALKQRKA